MLSDLAPSDHLSDAADEKLEQGELASRQRDLGIATPDPLCDQVDSQVTECDALGREWTPLAACERADPSQQLPKFERLGEISIGAGIEAFDPRVNRIPRRQHQHRHVGAGSTKLAAEC